MRTTCDIDRCAIIPCFVISARTEPTWVTFEVVIPTGTCLALGVTIITGSSYSAVYDNADNIMFPVIIYVSECFKFCHFFSYQYLNLSHKNLVIWM